MDIEVRKVSTEGGEAWRVAAGSMAFSFSCQESALAFAAKLKERIDAPHSLPDEHMVRCTQELATNP